MTRILIWLVSLCLGGALQAQVTITKTFSPQNIPLNGVSTLTIAVANHSPDIGLAFTDLFPDGLILASPIGLVSTCLGGTFSAGVNKFSLVFALAEGTSCAISVNVVATANGIITNQVPLLASTGQLIAIGIATLDVSAPPTILKFFGAPTIPLGGTTSLTFVVYNPNPVGFPGLSGVSFTDTLPAGLTVASPSGLTGSCGGGATITAAPATNLIGLSGGTLAGGASCVFSVNVTGTALGTQTNTTSSVTATQGGAGAPATAVITVLPPAEAFQVRYDSNLASGDSVINITNTGASSPVAFPNQDGDICANVYTFSPDEQLISCCSCRVTPNALVSLSARNDLISNTLTPGVPTSVVIKLLASTTPAGSACNASTVGFGGTNSVTLGMAAWGTTIHALPVTPGSPATTYGTAETAFTNATLSAAELTRITTLCEYIQTNGSGFGICKACRFGGLGAVEQ